MTYLSQGYDIYNELDLLNEATRIHNAAFDAANQMFSDVEKSLQLVKTEHWYPHYLFPKSCLANISPSPIVPQNLCSQPFEQATYRLGFLSGRLVVCKVITKYEYIRNAYGYVLLGPNNVPYTNVIDEFVETPIAVQECSRDIRVMVIENLPGFIEFVRSSIEVNTRTLQSAISHIKTNQ